MGFETILGSNCVQSLSLVKHQSLDSAPPPSVSYISSFRTTSPRLSVPAPVLARRRAANNNAMLISCSPGLRAVRAALLKHNFGSRKARKGQPIAVKESYDLSID